MATLATFVILALFNPLLYSLLNASPSIGVLETIWVAYTCTTYEVFSSIGDSPFVIIDQMNLKKVEVDVTKGTAWRGGGTTIGEAYYHIANASKDRYGFPAGTCPTVGSGGYINGGGFGHMSRKFGHSADNLLDALAVNAEGLLLKRTAMGDAMFWAIRGGGGGSWGIVVAWKLKLADINRNVTIFRIGRAEKKTVVNFVRKWQAIAYNFPNGFHLRAILAANSSRIIIVSFSKKGLPVLSFLTPMVGKWMISGQMLYPFRSIRNIYRIQYIIYWQRGEEDYKYLNWIKHFYEYTEPYVSKSPREAYVNYLGIDLGAAKNGTASEETAREWGTKDFQNNFDRLVGVKSQVDPHNVFINPQSIPVDPKQVH
ncbi:berberine bridge enzyme-like 28 [Amborella trichopoda]|nr:berberine bridge enzyme-like 28 [Amborella trichopoda]|eukprot:XP_020528270.1 berberine bridge enzyme-like 28 [Amborella trichopoda]